MIENNDFLAEINSPARKIFARVGLWNTQLSTQMDIYLSEDVLSSIKIERIGEGKFFGYGVCQKAVVTLTDYNLIKGINSGYHLKIEFGYKGSNGKIEYVNCNFPVFYITDVIRDQVTGEVTITAYDKLYWAGVHTTSELDKSTEYDVYKLAWGCCNKLGLQKPILIQGDITSDSAFIRKYKIIGQPSSISAGVNVANMNGTETIRELLDDIAEATQTIYFIQNDTLYFSRINKNTTSAYEITKDRYFSLDGVEESDVYLRTITKTNELGDAVTDTDNLTGETVYIKNNMLWENQEDIANLVDSALSRVNGFHMYQFDCKWRGNPLLTIGDKIGVKDKYNRTKYVHYINSTILYDGGLEEQTGWSYSESDIETANNPTSLGDVLVQTSAKVDKVNKQIELIVAENSGNSSTISSINTCVNGITSQVSKIAEQLDGTGGISEQISKIQQTVTQTITEEQMNIKISEAISDGTTKVETETGFTFDSTGLTIAKTGTPLTTTITENGMVVKRDNKEMLVANEQGVEAVNLNASTYLIIGKNSRFEDYGSNRTGCFWIGG